LNGKKIEKCYGSGGFINTLNPFVNFASLSWLKTVGQLDTLYDFVIDGPIVWLDADVYNLTPSIIQAVWTNLNKRVDIDLIAPSLETGYEECCGLFSQPIDLSFTANLGWAASINEEVVSNSHYWTRFLGLVPFSDDPTTRTGVHCENDYLGAHHYACHLEKYDYEPRLGRTVKTLYRPKTFSFEEICTFTLSMLLEGDLYNIDEAFVENPTNVGKKSVFNLMSQSQFLRYMLIICATRFSQEGWTAFSFETCEKQTTIGAGVNFTPYSDVFNLPVPQALSEFWGGIGVKMSSYVSGKSGYRIVSIPQLAVYGNTLANVYQNQAYSATPDSATASDMVSLLAAMNPRSTGVAGPYPFAPPLDALPDMLNVNTTVTLTSISVNQVSGTAIPDALEQVGDCIASLKGFVNISVNIANKDDVPFTVLYYTRLIAEPPMFTNMSGIYTVNYLNLTNRVYFDQRRMGSHIGVPLPISCAPKSVYQVIYSEFSITDVNNDAPFFLQTLRSAIQYAHPKESTSTTSEYVVVNETNALQGNGGMFQDIGEFLDGLLKG